MQQYLDRAGERYCLIGGLAVQRWGEPRVTRDVDVTLLCPFGSEAGAVDRLLAAFEPRLAGAREFAFRSRVLLLWAGNGIGVDVALGALPFEESCVRRASDWAIGPYMVLRTCGAEDLVVLKIFAGRPRDWLDVESVLLRQREVLDWSLILTELEPLLSLNETPERLDELKRLRDRIDQSA